MGLTPWPRMPQARNRRAKLRDVWGRLEGEKKQNRGAYTKHGEKNRTKREASEHMGGGGGRKEQDCLSHYH